jgi:cellulose synthase/poly-beta-1,6-N-acetylglucosamine synthase-like glycosyltransferase
MPGEKSEGFAPSCSVVICTRDRPEKLEQCLEAVARLNYPRVDVLVVDNAPSDSRTRQLAARWGVRYLVEPVAGLSRARNCGARACDTEVIAFLDDDAIPEPEWLSALAAEFQEPLVMAVTGRTLPLSIETDAERLFARLGGFESGGEERLAVDRQSPFWFERANFGGIGNGGNMAFRRRAFDLWPGFEERLGRGAIVFAGEEDHAFFTLIDRGYRVVYTPHAVARHPVPRTMPELRAFLLRNLSAATAYMTFLFVEEPRYRWAVIRYVAEALRGKRRAWRPPLPGTQPYPRVIPRWRALLAYLSGPALYVRSCLARCSPASRG